MIRLFTSAETANIAGYCCATRGEGRARDRRPRPAAIGKAVQRLTEMPRCGASRPGPGPHTRRLVIRPYILIYDYRSAADSVTLLRMAHGRRRITAAMLPSGSDR
ncbi:MULTISPECIES: type II toxin-antitoxin system RelE/ParE family toxin [Rhodomicrobium]|uniref:type II toxin-antitoxin system RelE/ParE family toxin n=1 Tax=Rhodomicrobium vannielii TaxID=1069 RepID=UPI000B4B21A8